MTIKRRVHLALALMLIIPLSFMLLVVGAFRHASLSSGGSPGEGEPFFARHLDPDENPLGFSKVVSFRFIGVIGLFILTSATLAYWVSKGIVTPLARLRAAAARIGEGDLDFSLEAPGNDEVAETTAAFETMRSKLKGALERKLAEENARKELIAHVSHDLRTPLSIIRGYAEGLRDGVPATAEDRERYATTILERADDLDRLIGMLFDYSSLELDDRGAGIEVIDARRFMEDLRATAMADYPGLDIGLTAPDKPLPMLADPARAARVVANIVENAVKYGGRPGVSMSWRLADAEGRVDIALSDDGPGVGAEDLPRLFEPFFRCDRSRRRSGSGLGLAIVRKLMESQGGAALARIGPSGGLEIALSFPGAG
jgi:signal transduction histidine kinase